MILDGATVWPIQTNTGPTCLTFRCRTAGYAPHWALFPPPHALPVTLYWLHTYHLPPADLPLPFVATCMTPNAQNLEGQDFNLFSSPFATAGGRWRTLRYYPYLQLLPYPTLLPPVSVPLPFPAATYPPTWLFPDWGGRRTRRAHHHPTFLHYPHTACHRAPPHLHGSHTRPGGTHTLHTDRAGLGHLYLPVGAGPGPMPGGYRLPAFVPTYSCPLHTETLPALPTRLGGYLWALLPAR